MVNAIGKAKTYNI